MGKVAVVVKHRVGCAVCSGVARAAVAAQEEFTRQFARAERTLLLLLMLLMLLLLRVC
jgi:hypothetical protein